MTCSAAVRATNLTLLLALVLAPLGCKDDTLAWSSEVTSPDGKFIARARGFVPGFAGIGNAGTQVDLNWTQGSQAPETILYIDDGSAETQPGNGNVRIEWRGPAKLVLSYTGPRHVDFQAVRCHGVDVALVDTSKEFQP